MAGAASSRGAKQAGRHLAGLLLEDRYRALWEPYGRRLRDGRLNQSAVGVVLARELWHEGHDDVNEIQMGKIAWRALRGDSLTRDRLEMFIAAFRIDDENAELLRQLWIGDEQSSVVIGELPRPDSPPTYQTIQLHEFHYLGPDGIPTHHRTVQAVRALTDGLAHHTYRFDTNSAEVERGHGGTPGEPYHVEGSLWAVDLAFPRVLKRRETHSLEYVTRFHYPEAPPPCFRRAVRRAVRDLMMRVEFHPDRLPAHAWFAEWADYEGPNDVVSHLEPVELDAENAVERHLDLVESAVVGFLWEF